MIRRVGWQGRKIRIRVAEGRLGAGAGEAEIGGVMRPAVDQMPLEAGGGLRHAGLAVEAVKWHVFQARKKLKELLKDYLQD